MSQAVICRKREAASGFGALTTICSDNKKEALNNCCVETGFDYLSCNFPQYGGGITKHAGDALCAVDHSD